VLVPEATGEQRYHEGNFKRFTGGDTVDAKGLYQDSKDMDFIGTIVISCNKQPRSKSNDKAFQRRMKIVLFRNSIPEDKQTLHKHKWYFEHEREGILRWLVEGKRMALANGIATPEAWRKALEEYKTEQDIPAETNRKKPLKSRWRKSGVFRCIFWHNVA